MGLCHTFIFLYKSRNVTVTGEIIHRKAGIIMRIYHVTQPKKAQSILENGLGGEGYRPKGDTEMISSIIDKYKPELFKEYSRSEAIFFYLKRPKARFALEVETDGLDNNKLMFFNINMAQRIYDILVDMQEGRYKGWEDLAR